MDEEQVDVEEQVEALADVGEKDVVVGYDGSPAARAAVDWAAWEAAASGRSLVVLHAAEFFGVLPGPVGPSLWLPVQAMDASRAVADEGVAQARTTEPSVPVRTCATGVGSPARALVHASRTASLVVVGSRGHGEVAGDLLGSVATPVVAHSACPTVVVRGDASRRSGPGASVLVGIDGSPCSLAALDAAAEHAARHGGDLHVVTAHTPPSPRSWDETYATLARPGDPPVDPSRAAADDVLARARGRVAERQPGLTARTTAAQGGPADVLVRLAADAAMLAVGSRGHGGFAGLLLGSVSRRVVHRAPCPVFVVRG